MANRMNKVRVLTGGVAAIMILSNMATLTTFAAEPEVVTVAVEQTVEVTEGAALEEAPVEKNDTQERIIVVPTGYRATGPSIEREENDCISEDDLKRPEISPELIAQIEAYDQARKSEAAAE